MFKKRAKVLSLIIILINLVTFPASSEIVNKINVTGNDRISDQTIIMFSDINLNDDLNLNDLDQILKKIYQSNFFDNVSVSLNNNILSIEVDEKPIIETIRYDGVKSDEIRAEIIKTRILKPRSSYDELSLAEERNKILQKAFLINNINKLPENDLVIHIRSGDIFNSKPHPNYIPPPLSYYTKEIDKYKYEKIHIICEDTINPVTNELRKLYKNAVYEKNTLEKDIRIILGATNIIYSVGTFIPSLMLLSDNNKYLQLTHSGTPTSTKIFTFSSFPGL